MSSSSLSNRKNRENFIVGIDEAGRGPLAGPVAVAAVKIGSYFNKNFFKGIKDSKQLTEQERERWYRLACVARRRGELDFSVTLVSAKHIDTQGIAHALRVGISRCVTRLSLDEKVSIVLDGSLKAPSRFLHQKTIIKGDEKIPVISLASVIAKVTRDRKMRRYSDLYPDYQFDIHKGYGTLAHRNILKTYRPSPIHRLSFLKKIL